MNKFTLSRNNAKKGAASLYVVVFVTILFGIITVSFLRIILSEAGQSSRDDLSRSAYDSALAGVEDAKIAVNEYFKCINTSGDSDSCKRNGYALFSDPSAGCESGIPLAGYLYGSTGEVKIQENSTSGNFSDQAYTCVIISDKTPDYRGTLSADTRTRVVPIGVSRNTSQSNLSSVARVRLSWYSQLNQGSNSETNTLSPTTLGSINGQSSPLLPNLGNKTTPPAIQLTIIKVPSTINLADFHPNTSSASDTKGLNNSGNSINSTFMLIPTEINDAGGALVMSSVEIKNAGNAVDSSGVSNQQFPNSGKEFICSTSTPFACNVEFMADDFNNGDTVLFVVSLPYGDAYTDFAITLLDSSNKPIDMKGVQISVDSTGRTNQLFRRVETRLDPADLFFPYPMYALELDGGADPALLKYFWITANCWTETATCTNNGPLT